MTYGYKQTEDGTLVPHPVDTQLPKSSIECPNCITPWKCNGPHLFKVHDTLYRSDYGYFLLNTESSQYVFIPNEKEYSTDDLIDISDTLRNLNKKTA